MSATYTSSDKTCKTCRKNPRYTNANGTVTSLYCSNVCAKRAGAPLPNPQTLVKRAKDSDLSQLLAQQADIEKAKDNPVVPASVTSLLSTGVWKLESNEGTADVLLTRMYNNEEIRVKFHMAELDPFEPDHSDEEDTNEGIAHEESDDDDEISAHHPTECHIFVSKPCGGTLLFDCYAFGKILNILKISFMKDARLAGEESAEGQKKILASGVGPEFDTLPKRIKEEFNNYLKERGIDDTLGHAINDFTEYKTQKEALGWFEAVGAFVSSK